MAKFKFTIPLQLKDLSNHSGKGEYTVENEYSVRELKLKLNEIKTFIRQHGCNFVIINGGFDIIYSVLLLFHRDLPTEMKHTAFEASITAMGDLIKVTDLFICGRDSSNEPNDKLTASNRMKMNAFLFCQLVELIESDALQVETASAAMGKLNKKGKKKTTDEEDMEAWNWDERRQECVNILFRLMNLNVHTLFDPPIAEEEFVSLVGNCCFRLLENPSIGLQRCRDVRVSIFQVLGTLVSKYNYGLSCRLKMVQELKLFEHLAVPMAEAMEKFVTDYNCRTILLDVVREIDRVDEKEMSRDTSGTRAFSQFLIELAERVPEQLQPCLSLLMKHLDGESYMLRKSILCIFGEIVIKLYSKEQLDEAAKNSRDQYLDQLEMHMHDVNAHVRSAALNIWSKLCQSKAIPLSRQHTVLKLVVGRLKDKSSIVRKQSVQLLTQLLQCNPYDAALCVETLKERLNEEKVKLTALLPKDDAEESAKKWTETEKALQEYFAQDTQMDDDRDELWENAHAGEIHERIRYHLTKRRFGSAVTLLAAAKEKFPVFKKLEAIEKEDEAEDEEDDDEDEKRVPLSEQFRRIFFMPLVQEGVVGEEEEDEATQNPEMNELLRQQHLVNFLQEAVQFALGFDEALPVVCTLLGSKQASDVIEAINFFVSAFEFGLLNAMMGVRKMLGLIFSRETTIQKAVVDAYKKLYISPVMAGNSANAIRANNIQMVKNLMALVNGATIGDLAGLEELIGMLVASKDIDKSCFQVMWQFFTKVLPDEMDNYSRSALILLGMVAVSEPHIITSNINVLVEHGLGQEGRDNFRLVHDTCMALLKVGGTKNGPDGGLFRLNEDHDLFVRLEFLLLDGIDDLRDDAYVPMSQQAIAVVYQLSEVPDATIGRLCKQMVEKISSIQEKPDINLELILSRFFFVIGHVAVCHLNYLDVAVFNELKRRSQMREAKKENEKVAAAAAAKKRTPASTVRRRQSALETPRNLVNGGAAKGDDDVDEVVGAEADDTEAEFIRNLCEKRTVTGDNLLANLAPILVDVCSATGKYAGSKLRAAASLALTKFMLVSSEFCENNLQLFFTLLEKSEEQTIRANLIVAAGDLSFRFPNTLEPWTPRMYACLRDESSLVRKNTLTVLTHLILNDMIKVKGQISDMALCIIDDEGKIASLAKLFFTELAHKGNALYNVMPDIISRLSDPEAGLEEDKFQDIMKYIIGLIEKDKHLESLVEKLCQRFRVTKTERQWRDLAFCLSNFAYNDKALKKLVDNFGCFSDKLHEDKVYEAFVTIITTAKKSLKAETKTVLEELLSKIEEERAKQVEDDTAAKRAANAAAAKKKTTTGSKSKRRAARKESSSEEDNDDDDVEEEDDKVDEEAEKENIKRNSRNTNNITTTTVKKSAAAAAVVDTPEKTKQGRRRVVQKVQSSDEDDFEEQPQPKAAKGDLTSSTRSVRSTRRRR